MVLGSISMKMGPNFTKANGNTTGRKVYHKKFSFSPLNPNFLGTGCYYYPDSANLMYSGAFKDNKKQGEGVSFHKNGFKNYSGNFYNDLMDGFGHLYDRNGNLKYIGNFRQNQKDGDGQYYFYNKCLCYEGSYKNDKRSGYGDLYDFQSK
jgi:antitoxin component YwqK of YwqJK toxin-antitoxin module